MEIKEKEKSFGISGSTLKIMCMFLMFSDHSYNMLLPDVSILKSVGRLAFPIFCFVLVEGFRHTHDVKRYMARLAIFGIISEIPYNLLAAWKLSYIQGQNVMWTMLIGLCMLQMLKECEEYTRNNRLVDRLADSVVICCLGFTLGELFNVDYGGWGVLQIILFYLVSSENIYKKCLQTAGMIVIHTSLPSRIIEIGSFCIKRQQLGILSLLFIWLYNGKRGIKNKYFQYACYWFYPVHIMVLALIKYSIGGGYL